MGEPKDNSIVFHLHKILKPITDDFFRDPMR